MDWKPDQYDLQSLWCKYCNQFLPLCTCDVKQHIFIVNYRLSMEDLVIKESVRCIAEDIYSSMCKVTSWLMDTPYLWRAEEGKQIEHFYRGFNNRKVSILKVSRYMEDIGDILSKSPINNIFPIEDVE